MIKPIVNKRNQVYEYVYNAIKNKEIKSGQILSERELANELGISRTPIREAFQQLIKDGIVENEQYRGVKVVSMTIDKVTQLYQVREVLEGLSARLLAEKQDQQVIEELGELLRKAEASIVNGNIELLSDINAQFHNKIVKTTKNCYLNTALKRLQTHISLMMTTSLSSDGRPLQNIQEHWMIVNALEKGDERLAEEAMRHHIRNAYDTAIKELEINKSQN